MDLVNFRFKVTTFQKCQEKILFSRQSLSNIRRVDENDNKPEPEDATHDKVDDFNEDTFDLCAYDF